LQKFLDLIRCAPCVEAVKNKEENNNGVELFVVDDTDNDEDDIIVTRVYASSSADNIVKHHDDKLATRSESDIDIHKYISKKVQERPNLKTRNNSEWQIASLDVEVRRARLMNFHSDIYVEYNAEYSMFADVDTDFNPEQEPSNHQADEEGDMGEWF
jgi:hypothetical protein